MGKYVTVIQLAVSPHYIQLRKFIVQANNKGVSKSFWSCCSLRARREKTFRIYAIMFCQTFSTFAFVQLLLSNKSRGPSNYFEWEMSEMSRFEAYNLKTAFCLSVPPALMTRTQGPF